MNEACRLRDAGILQRVSDVDLAVEKGLMAKKSKGGPLIQSDLNGSLSLARAMAELRDIDPALWRPQPRFADMVKNGKRFFEGQV